MRDYIEKACEEIDAAVFSGDAFENDEESIKELSIYMSRWWKELTCITINNKIIGEKMNEEIQHIEIIRSAKSNFAISCGRCEKEILIDYGEAIFDTMVCRCPVCLQKIKMIGV